MYLNHFPFPHFLLMLNLSKISAFTAFSLLLYYIYPENFMLITSSALTKITFHKIQNLTFLIHD